MNAHSRAPIRFLETAGVLLFVAGVVILMGIITAEAVYPGYSTSGNMISDLGATEPQESIILQPSATIFDGTMVLSGLLVLAAAYLLYRGGTDRPFTVLLALVGAGITGVGIFNGSYGTIHALFALLAFAGGGITCIAAWRAVGGPYRMLSVILGVISLGTLAGYYLMGSSSPFAVLGMGGVERWVAYPIVLWITGFGGYLMGDREKGIPLPS